MLGGSVGMKSQPGGSKFWAELPLETRVDTRVDTRLNPQQFQKQPPESAARRILVAEDNRVNQLILTRSLQKLGYEVDVAGTGLETIEKWESINYDAIRMDCQVPE